MTTSQSYIARIEAGGVRPSTGAFERFACDTRASADRLRGARDARTRRSPRHRRGHGSIPVCGRPSNRRQVVDGAGVWKWWAASESNREPAD